jgi:serine/threonine protein kinase
VRKLGKGGFGEVYLGRHFLTGEEYAIKKIQFKNRLPADKVEEIFREEKNLQKLKHPNIIKLMNVFKVNAHLVLMLEYLPGGDLKHFMMNRKKTMESTALGSGLAEEEVVAII